MSTPVVRVTLVAGPYHPPRTRVGGTAHDVLRGDVIVRGIAGSPLPWPYTLRARAGGPRSPIVTEELARAVLNESRVAVAYWWGVGIGHVSRLRRRLQVPEDTPGTSMLRGRPRDRLAGSDLPLGCRVARTMFARLRHLEPRVSQAEAARRAGLPRQRLSAWLAGRKQPTLDSLTRLESAWFGELP